MYVEVKDHVGEGYYRLIIVGSSGCREPSHRSGMKELIWLSYYLFMHIKSFGIGSMFRQKSSVQILSWLYWTSTKTCYIGDSGFSVILIFSRPNLRSLWLSWFLLNCNLAAKYKNLFLQLLAICSTYIENLLQQPHAAVTWPVS